MRMLLIFTLLLHQLEIILSTTPSIRVIHNVSIVIPNSNSSIMNGTCDECLCAMVLNNTVVSTLNCFHTNQTCELFSTDLESSSFWMMNDLPSSFYFLSFLISDIPSTTARTNQITTTSMSTITVPRPIVSITQADDLIIGVFNTTAGGSSGGINGSYSSATEYPPCAIDHSVATKYLNRGINAGGLTVSQPGLNTGFYVTPASSNASVTVALLFATANDVPERDPITVTLEGTNETSSAALNLGSSWTLIYSGPTGINPTADPGRSMYVPQQRFSNTRAFRSYRLLVTSQRANTPGVQYAEAQIIGYL